MTGGFVRRVARYPLVFLRQQGEVAEDRSFVRRVAVPPGRFILTDPHSHLPAREIPPALLDPGEPGEKITPIDPVVYLGRVEEVDADDGSCLVRVWEVPGGRAGTATVTRQQLGDVEVVAGDTLRIYTWLELPAELDEDGARNPRERIRVEVTPRDLPLDKIEALQARVAALTRDAPA